MSNPLLNWDHDVIPTSQEDILANLAHYVSEYTGYMEVSVNIENNTLSVDCSSCSSNYRLVYDIKNRKEVYGRIRSVGITLPMLETIHTLA